MKNIKSSAIQCSLAFDYECAAKFPKDLLVDSFCNINVEQTVHSLCGDVVTNFIEQFYATNNMKYPSAIHVSEVAKNAMHIKNTSGNIFLNSQKFVECILNSDKIHVAFDKPPVYVQYDEHLFVMAPRETLNDLVATIGQNIGKSVVPRTIVGVCGNFDVHINFDCGGKHGRCKPNSINYCVHNANKQVDSIMLGDIIKNLDIMKINIH